MSDELNGRPIFFECCICHGANKRARKSDGSRNCAAQGCNNVRKRLAEAEPEAAPRAVCAAPTKCYKVKDVLGFSVGFDLSADERRVGRAAEDDDYFVHVRGGFGANEEEDAEDLIPDTRWVQFAELVHTGQDKEAMKQLDRAAKGLGGKLKAAARRIRDRDEDEEDE